MGVGHGMEDAQISISCRPSGISWYYFRSIAPSARTARHCLPELILRNLATAQRIASPFTLLDLHLTHGARFLNSFVARREAIVFWRCGERSVRRRFTNSVGSLNGGER